MGAAADGRSRPKTKSRRDRDAAGDRDVNFGVITHELRACLERSPNFKLALNHEVSALRQNEDKNWNVTINWISRLVAGPHSSRQFLAFEAPALTDRHSVKAYGIAETGSPPMSVPHLDAPLLDGKPVMLFGPFALYSTKFVKHTALGSICIYRSTTTTSPAC